MIAGISLLKILDQKLKDPRRRPSQWPAIKHKFQTTNKSDEGLLKKNMNLIDELV